MRYVRLVRAVLLALCLFPLAASGARADLADKILQYVLDYAGIDPDAIEAARFAIHSPDHAAKVFGHAAEYDIPFFAIVGAVKAAKDKSFGGVTFSEGICVAPIAMVDQVFGASSAYIDDAAGKAKTTGIVNTAKQYGVKYAKEQNATARQQLLDTLTENVPYFNELPVICDFAFNTSFTVERNIQSVVNDQVRDLRDAYNAFADGEISDGISKLLEVGITAETACKIADDAISGGFITKTPILGDIASSACQGFAGTVIKGIASGAKAVYNKGKQFIEDAACTVAGLLGGCDDADPPPPTGYSTASGFCAPFGGVQSLLSKNNQPDDWSVICNDGSACRARPGKETACQTAARTELRKWTDAFWGKWVDACQEDICRNNMPAIREAGFEAGIATIAAQPTIGWPALYNTAVAEYDGEAQAELDASQVRFVQINKSITENASQGWVELTTAVWAKKCWDQQCRTEVEVLAREFGKALIAAQDAEPDASSLSIQGKVGKQYGPKFQAIIDASNKRKIIADPNAPLTAKLGAYGCKAYLGRAKEWLCPGVPGAFATCVATVKSGQSIFCASTTNLMYGTPERTISALKSQKCTRVGDTGLDFACASDSGREVCGHFVNGGMANVNCNAVLLTIKPKVIAPVIVPKVLPAPAIAPRAALAAIGCQQFGRNPQDWICPDANTFRTCAGFVRTASDQIAACLERDNNAIYSTDRRAIAFLEPQGCRNDGAAPLAFTCTTSAAMSVCQQFVTGGMRMVCKPPVINLLPKQPTIQLRPLPRQP
jgi:hypothetical protein